MEVEVDSPEIELQENVAPLYDQVRLAMFNTYEKGRHLYERLWVHRLATQKRGEFDQAPRLSHDELAFVETVYSLYHLLSSKIKNRNVKRKASKKESDYAVLEQLSDPAYVPKLQECFVYFQLMRDFLEEIGIFKIENWQYSHGLGQQATKGFVSGDR